MNPEQFTYSIAEAVIFTSIGRSKLYQLINAGALPARKVGKRTIILREDLEAFLKSLHTYAPKKKFIDGAGNEN